MKYLILSLIVSVLGYLVFRRGKKEANIYKMVAGVILMVSTYFTSSIIILLIISAIAFALPYAILFIIGSKNSL